VSFFFLFNLGRKREYSFLYAFIVYMSNNSNSRTTTNDEDEDDNNFLRGIPTATIGNEYDYGVDDNQQTPYVPTDESDTFSRHVVTHTDRHPDEVDMDVPKYEGNVGGKSIRRRKTNRRRKSTKRRKTNRRRKSTKRRNTSRRRKHKGTRKRA